MSNVLFSITNPASLRDETRSLLETFRAYATWHGIDLDFCFTSWEDDPLDLQWDGNSALLHQLRDEMTQEAAQLARDVAPGSRTAQSLAETLLSSLPSSKGRSLSPVSNSGRANWDKFAGHHGPVWLKIELQHQHRRCLDDWQRFTCATGPDAWRQRREARVAMQVDGMALVGAARRLLRLADDYLGMISEDSELRTAVDAFKSRYSPVRHMRDIGEHMDEYQAGTGQRQVAGREPRSVTISVECAKRFAETQLLVNNHRVRLDALGEASVSLCDTLGSAFERNYFELAFPEGWGAYSDEVFGASAGDDEWPSGVVQVQVPPAQ